MTDSSGNVVERYTYDAYGKMYVRNADGSLKASQVPMQPYGFTGRRYDSESGLWYFRARYFDDQLGRFIGRDPLGYVDGMSMYGGYFVPGGMDPWGLSDWECSTVIVVSHTRIAKRIMNIGPYLPRSGGGSLYPISCRNQQFYLPIGVQGNYGGEEEAHLTAATGNPEQDNKVMDDMPELREFITEGLNELSAGGRKEKLENAFASIENKIKAEAEEGGGRCCNCEELCFYVFWIMSSHEREIANWVPGFGNVMEFGAETGYVTRDPAVWKEDPVAARLKDMLYQSVDKKCWENKVVAEKSNLWKDYGFKAVAYKKCFPCPQEGVSSGD